MTRAAARPFRLGLTGSIGMGKSTTAGFFAAAGIPVWDADASVGRLYSAGGAAVDAIGAHWPHLVRDRAVDRPGLRTLVADRPETLARIEALVHPLVAMDRATWLASRVARLVVLDIPLLFETGAERDLDATLLVTAPASVQRARVLARPGMTEDRFGVLLARQMPDAQKRARATHIVETLSLASTEACVNALLDHLGSLDTDA